MSESGSSFALIPTEVLATRNGYAIAVYAAIARHADRGGVAWPSLQLLAEMTGWSRPTVVKAIGVLVDADLLVKRHRHQRSGNQSNEYLLPLHTKGAKMDPAPVVDPPAKFGEVGNDVYCGSEPESTTFTVAPTVNDVDHAETARVNDVDQPQLTTLPTHSKPRFHEQDREKNNSQAETTAPKLAVQGDTPAHRIVNEFYRLIGGMSPAPGKDIGHAKSLHNAGVRPSDLPELIDWVQNDWTGKDGFDLATIVRGVTRWRTDKAKKAAQPEQVRRWVV